MSKRKLTEASHRKDSKRALSDILIGGIDLRDSPDFVDAYIMGACWQDTGEQLTEEELEKINEDTSLVYHYVIKQLC